MRDFVFVSNPYSPFDKMMGEVVEVRYRDLHEEYAVAFPPNKKLHYRTTSLCDVSELRLVFAAVGEAIK